MEIRLCPQQPRIQTMEYNTELARSCHPFFNENCKEAHALPEAQAPRAPRARALDSFPVATNPGAHERRKNNFFNRNDMISRL